MPSVLFVCRHNACRSQIAEAVCRSVAPGWRVASAGLQPSSQVDAKAVEILRRHGVSMAEPSPKGFPGLPPVRWDVVIVIGIGSGDLRGRVPSDRYIEWDIPDPNDGPMELYEALFRGLAERIERLAREAERSSR